MTLECAGDCFGEGPLQMPPGRKEVQVMLKTCEDRAENQMLFPCSECPQLYEDLQMSKESLCTLLWCFRVFRSNGV